jgi:hypothetical protein
VRVRVEHALAGVKRCRIVKEVFRNTKEPLSDLVMVVVEVQGMDCWWIVASLGVYGTSDGITR